MTSSIFSQKTVCVRHFFLSSLILMRLVSEQDTVYHTIIHCIIKCIVQSKQMASTDVPTIIDKIVLSYNHSWYYATSCTVQTYGLTLMRAVYILYSMLNSLNRWPRTIIDSMYKDSLS